MSFDNDKVPIPRKYENHNIITGLPTGMAMYLFRGNAVDIVSGSINFLELSLVARARTALYLIR